MTRAQNHTNNHIDPGMVRFRQTCAELGFHPNTGYRYIKEDRFPIPVLTIGDIYYCRRADIDRYLQARVS